MFFSKYFSLDFEKIVVYRITDYCKLRVHCVHNTCPLAICHLPLLRLGWLLPSGLCYSHYRWVGSMSQESTPRTTGTGFLQRSEERRNYGISEIFTVGMALASPQQCFYFSMRGKLIDSVSRRVLCASLGKLAY